MSAMSNRLPEITVVLGLAGFGAWWMQRGDDAPPPERRCGAHAQDTDCFRPVPGGTFLMGAQAHDPDAPGYDAAATEEEGPPHRVHVSPFWMMQTEASVALYRACVAAEVCDEDAVSQGHGFSTYTPHTADDHETVHEGQMPINGIDWATATTLCAFVGGRLPTEAEWEWAARGAEHRRWAWGDDPACPHPDLDRAFDLQHGTPDDRCEQDGPLPANGLPNPSPFLLMGMSGNLWEWTADGWAADAYTQHAAQDPRTPAGPIITQRGGGWTSTDPLDVRATVRGGMDPSARLNDVGVRCAFGGAAP